MELPWRTSIYRGLSGLGGDLTCPEGEEKNWRAESESSVT